MNYSFKFLALVLLITAAVSCKKSTTPAPDPGSLGGSPGSCTGATTAGTYAKGIALTSSNTITIQVNVGTPAAYTISTNTVNGVSFSKSGTFTTSGVQNVVLTGTGTPLASGAQTFTVTFGASTCSFVLNFDVTFLATVNGTSEVPTNASAFTGTCVATFNASTKILNALITHNVTTPTNGHFHKGAVGVSGPVIFAFSSLSSPIIFTSVALDATQEADLNNNLYYANIHTAAFPGGEIRGQLIKQ